MAREKGLSHLYYIFLKLNLSKERPRMMKTEELGKRDYEAWRHGDELFLVGKSCNYSLPYLMKVNRS